MANLHGRNATIYLGTAAAGAASVVSEQNDYSIEADPRLAECAPCHRIIYDKWMQCPVDEGPSCANDGPDTPCGRTHAVMCMSRGLPVERVYDRVREAIGNHVPEEKREARRHRHLSLVRP